jgi:hypothetical protein
MPDEPATWSEFIRTKPAFVEIFSATLFRLKPLLLETVPSDDDLTGSLLWRFIFASILDCNDILTLVSNGGDWGALKLLRSLFERTVTAKYLETHSAETVNFYDFDAIDYRSAMDAIYVESGISMSPESRANLDRAAAKARIRFKLEPCPSCNRPARMSAWTPRSMKELSEKTGLGYMYFTAWILPTKLIHPTFYGLEEVILGNAPIYNTLYNVHSLLVELILIHQRHFEAETAPTELMIESVEQFLSVWTISRTDFGLPLKTL